MSDKLHLFDPKRAPFRWETVSRNAGEYSGEYAEVFPFPPDGLVALLSSSSEPGESGAMWMMLTRSVYRLGAMSGKRPAEVLLATHRLLARDAPGVSDDAACVRIEFARRRLAIARAGNVHALLLHASSREAEWLPGCADALGHAGVEEGLSDHEMPWERGDMLVLCGCGTTRVASPQGMSFGEDRLCAALVGAPPSAKEAAEALSRAIDAHAGSAPRTADVSILVVELRGE